MQEDVPISDQRHLSQGGYHPAARAFHWLVAALVFVIWPLGALTSLVQSAYLDSVFFWHQSLGFLLFWLMLARLCVRFLVSPPDHAWRSSWALRLARTSHWLLYLLLIAQPMVGFLLTNAYGYPLRWFGWFVIWSPIDASQIAANYLAVIHEWGAWAILVLTCIHVAAAVFHRVVKRDGLLQDMV